MPVCGWKLAFNQLKTGLCLGLLFPLMVVADTLELKTGIQESYKAKGNIERVAIGDPDVLEVTVTAASELLMTPQQAGLTSLKIWTSAGQEALEVEVSASGKHLQNQLDQLKADYQLTATGDKMQLDGDIASLEEHAAVRATLASEEADVIDSSTFSHDAQVQIDIKIVEISKTKLQSAGFFLGKGLNGRTPRALSSPGGIAGASVQQSGTSGEGPIGLLGNGFIPDTDSFNLVYGRRSNGLLTALSVLEGNGFAYTLAEPSLMAMSGQSANFLAGGEFPVPVRGGGFDNSVTIEYKEFGVRVSLTPTVLDDLRIALKVAPEVSELDFNAGIETAGVTVPALRVRRTDTTVALGDGESFVISGLVSQNTIANVDKLPGLGDIPILGAFFRSNKLDREDRELLMIVTPRLVQPMARNAELPELPGEKYRNYDPGFAEFLFLEDGRFADRPPVTTGFSK